MDSRAHVRRGTCPGRDEPSSYRVPPRRNQAIELLRIVAAYGIVAYHAGAPFREVTYAGLVVFLILAPYVSLAGNRKKARSVRSLAVAYLVPWLFWLLFYGMLNLKWGRPLLPVENPVAGLLYGTSEHLWFLPAVFIAIALLNFLTKRIPVPVLFWISALGAALLLASAPVWRSAGAGLVPPLGQWIHAAPGLLIGVALGLAGQLSFTARAFAATLVGTALICLAFRIVPGVSGPYLVGTLAAAIAIAGHRWRLPANLDVQPLSSCTLGVYLSHIFWLAVFYRVSGEGSYTTVTAAFLCALGATWLLQRLVPPSQWVIGRGFPFRMDVRTLRPSPNTAG